MDKKLQATDWQRIVSVTTLKQPKTQKPLEVTLPKRLSRTRKSSIPAIKFERHNLSSYGGLVVFQKLFADIGLSARLGECVPAESKRSRHASFSLIWRLLVVNALLGMPKLRDLDHCRDDPFVLRTLGAQPLPSVPTVSRMLEDCDGKFVSKLQVQSHNVVL